MPSPTNPYIIQGGQAGADRLWILTEVMMPYTEPFIHKAGIYQGMKCLDVGCGAGAMSARLAAIAGEQGHVTGIDFDPTVIDIARRNVTAPNTEFKVLNIESDDLTEQYDFIFCRFVLSHLRSPAVALEKLKKALRPGGKFAIEDVDFAGHFCYPPSHAFERYIQLYTETAIRKGGNPLLGAQLLELVSNSGFSGIEIDVVLPTFRNGNGKKLALLTFIAIKDALIAEQHISEEEMNSLIEQLTAYTDNELTLMSLPRITQISMSSRLRSTTG